jgi:hypothetical protein
VTKMMVVMGVYSDVGGGGMTDHQLDNIDFNNNNDR